MLAPLGSEHAPALFRAFGDRELHRYIPDETPYSVAMLAERYRFTAAGPRDPAKRWWNWAVAELREPDVPFGTVEVSLEADGARALLAYMLARSAWGRGFAREACAAALALIGTAGTRTVDAYADTRNARSVALLERLGFTRVATISNADHFKGSPSDEYQYRLTLATGETNDGKT